MKFANAQRALFLVDRSNLGRQTLKESQPCVTPDNDRKFTELYKVRHLQSNTLDPISRVCITTIQRLYSMLSGAAEFDAHLKSHFVGVDAIGVVEQEKTETLMLKRKRSMSLPS